MIIFKILDKYIIVGRKIENEKKYSYLSNNVKLFTISSFGQKILSFLLVPLYTSYLNTQEYGIIDLVATTINIIIPIFHLILLKEL